MITTYCFFIIQTRPVVKKSSAAGSHAKQVKQDLSKEEDKPGKTVGRASGSSSGDIYLLIYPRWPTNRSC